MAKTSKVTTPVAGYSGLVAGVSFVDGKGETDDPAALAYFRRRGYTVDGTSTSTRDADDPEPADPRKVDDQTAGTRLRDAAVDPKSRDFLPPTNAGEENPHGPKVVSPEIHGSKAVKVPGVVPGPVPSDPAEQESKETAAIDGQVERPPGNGSKDAWHSYALANGKTADELEDLTRDEIRDQFPEQ